MDCLRSWFSCCCISDCCTPSAPLAKYTQGLEQGPADAPAKVSIEDALLPADDCAKANAKVKTCAELLTLVAGYAAEGQLTVRRLQRIRDTESPLQKLLVEQRPTLVLDAIPPANECAALAQRLTSVANLRLISGATTEGIPHLRAFHSTQFIAISDYNFFLNNIALLTGFPNLVGIDIIPIGEPIDPVTDLQPEMQLQQLGHNHHMQESVAPLFQEMPQLTYVHIRDGIHIRYGHLNRLSQACQDYVQTTCVLEKATPRPEAMVFLNLPPNLANRRFSELVIENIDSESN